MADNLTTTSEVDPGTQVFYDRVLLERSLPDLIYEIGAQVRNIPVHGGDQIKMRRYTNLTAATTPLTEGVTPPGQQMSKTDIMATVKQYGDFVHITDVVVLIGQDRLLTEAAELLGEQQGETRDTLVRDVLVATASVSNASGGSNGDTPTEITKTDIDGVVKVLGQGRAKEFRPRIKAGTGQGTSPIRKAYIGKLDVDITDDLEKVSGFLSVAQYPSQAGVEDSEWGSTNKVRWLKTDIGHVSTGASTLSADVYSCLIHGQNAFGVTTIEQGNSKNIVKGYGSAGTADPLNQRATSGWKMMHACRILNDAHIHNLKVTHS